MDNVRAPGPTNHPILTPQQRGGRNFHNRNRGDRNFDRRGDRGDRNDRRSTVIPKQDRPKKEAILDLRKYYDQKVLVKFIGGRLVVGVLKGYDQLMNLVLDDVVETLRDPEDDAVLTEQTRPLGTVVVRGPQMLTLSPLEGTESIDNPFAQQQ